MLADLRSRSLLALAFFLVFLVSLQSRVVQAQVNGVPPSVTSIGFGGRFLNGIPASVTSIGFGQNGKYQDGKYQGPASVYGWPTFGVTPPPTEHHHKHKDQAAVVGILEPAYIPYAPQDDDGAAADPNAAPNGPTQQLAMAPPGLARPSMMAPEPEQDPVEAQPETVLVFKDGHQADVLNYAIVGDTLFDFAEGRTRKIQLADLDLKATQKANDDRGVDFRIPGSVLEQ
jgi:hypothetical protein